MKKLILAFTLSTMLFVGCGSDDSTTPTPTENVLNKELLYDKQWTNESQTFIHTFHSDGTYGVNDKWEWVNDSDTIITINSGTNKTFTWVINKGNTANRMEAKLATSDNWAEFRTSW